MSNVVFQTWFFKNRVQKNRGSDWLPSMWFLIFDIWSCDLSYSLNIISNRPFQFLVAIYRYTWTLTFSSIFVSLIFSFDELQHLIFLWVLQTFFFINAIALTRRGSVTSNCFNSWKIFFAQSHSSTFLHGQFSVSIDSENR